MLAYRFQAVLTLVVLCSPDHALLCQRFAEKFSLSLPDLPHQISTNIPILMPFHALATNEKILPLFFFRSSLLGFNSDTKWSEQIKDVTLKSGDHAWRDAAIPGKFITTVLELKNMSHLASEALCEHMSKRSRDWPVIANARSRGRH